MNINTLQKTAILQGGKALIGSIFAGIMVGFCLLGIILPQATNADFANTTNASYVAKTTNDALKAVKTISAVITAYSSTPDQTDDTPFITASGKMVRDGIIANNMLPIGTKVRIPELYGDKVFTVEDRMNRRMGDHRFDIWFETYNEAKNFGVKSVGIEVLES